MFKKTIIYMLFLTALNGCVQGVALLGPAFSYSQSGSVLQSSLSYASNLAIKKIKNKPIVKDQSNALDNNKTINNNNDLFDLVKNKIENSSSIKNLVNQ